MGVKSASISFSVALAPGRRGKRNNEPERTHPYPATSIFAHKKRTGNGRLAGDSVIESTARRYRRVRGNSEVIPAQKSASRKFGINSILRTGVVNSSSFLLNYEQFAQGGAMPLEILRRWLTRKENGPALLKGRAAFLT